MRSSDWSSDVCSSDLLPVHLPEKPDARNRFHYTRCLIPHKFLSRYHGTTMPLPAEDPLADQWARSYRNFGWRRPQPVDCAQIPLLYIPRSEEHTSELQSLMRISYAVFFFKKKHKTKNTIQYTES